MSIELKLKFHIHKIQKKESTKERKHNNVCSNSPRFRQSYKHSATRYWRIKCGECVAADLILIGFTEKVRPSVI